MFALLIIVHELGHFLVAKRAGVVVEEFGIGFPPRLFKFRPKRSKTLYSVNLIPLGGFVKLKGETNSDKRPGTFGAARFLNKAKILLAGVGMNVAAAFMILLILALTKLPVFMPNQFTIPADEIGRQTDVIVTAVAEDSPAAAAGISAGTTIQSIDGQPVTGSDMLTNYTRTRANQNITLAYLQDSEQKTAALTLAQTEEGTGRLGVVPFDNTTVRYGLSAPVVAAGATLQLVWLTVKGLGLLIWGLITEGGSAEALDGAVGPVGLFALFNSAGELGITYLLMLVAVISASLAVINALPLPALDGGRLALISAFKAFKKPLAPAVENAVHTIGFILLLGLVILISYFDWQRFF